MIIKEVNRTIENLSREEAVALLGESLIQEVESLNCDYTNRVADGTEWDGFTEFMASLELTEKQQKILARSALDVESYYREFLET